jgi:hypothetical protein
MSHEERDVYWWIISSVELEPSPHYHYRVVDSGMDWDDPLRDYDPCNVNAGPFENEEEAKDFLMYLELPSALDFQIQYDDLELEDFVRNRERKNRRAVRFARKELDKDGKLNPAVRRILRELKEGR